MADGFSSPAQQVAEALSEAVVKPVSDEVGKALEQGAQSVTGQTLDPAVQQKKEVENQKKLAWAQKVIAWYKQVDGAQKMVRQEKQQATQVQQQEQQQEREVQQYKLVEKQQKQQELTHLQKEARKTEIRGGVGG